MYTPPQRRQIAHEFARAGGDAAAAAKKLKARDKRFARISANSIYGCRNSPEFATLIAEQAKAIVDAAEARARTRSEFESSLMESFRRDETILEKVRKKTLDALEEENFDVKLAAALYERLSKLHDRRRERTLPAIGESRQAAALVEAVMETAMGAMGQGKASAFLKRVRVRYEAKAAERAESAESESAGAPVASEPPGKASGQ